MLTSTEIHKYRAMLQNARTPEEAVRMEQLRAIQQNVPALYLMLSVSMAAVALMFRGAAPSWLVLGFPLLMFVVGGVRVLRWRRLTDIVLNPQSVRRKLRNQLAVTLTLYAVVGLWVWALLPYADAGLRTCLIFFLTFTGAVATLCTLSRPASVAISLSMTLAAYCFLFLGASPRIYPFVITQAATTYIVFYMAARGYKRRLVQSVALLNRLNAENRRSAELAHNNQSMAMSDMLTGLPNRRQFFLELDASYKPEVDGTLPVVGLVDLDGFKPVNDVFGHSAGDAVLVETAERLKRVLGEEVSLARLGGDEFAFILPTYMTDGETRKMAQSVVDAMIEPVRLPSDDTSRVTASVGYSSRAFPVKSPRDLLEQADFALFQAKKEKTGRAVEFSAEHAETQLREAMVHTALKKADLDKEIHLVFQPIVNSTDGTLTRCEALARWISPDLGEVSPVEFVAVAEKAGLTHHLTRTVVRKALDCLADCPALPSMSVNLSAQDVISRETTDALVNMLLQTPEHIRQRLVLEVTESSLLNDLEEARTNLLKFRFLGLKIALDDFGTGYSSLRYLLELEFDIVKIDRSFGSVIDTKPRGLGLVATIQHLCRSLGIECIIEGIETPQQLEIARSAGCRQVQGFLYACPMTPEQLQEYVDGTRRFPSYLDLLSGPSRSVA